MLSKIMMVLSIAFFVSFANVAESSATIDRTPPSVMQEEEEMVEIEFSEAEELFNIIAEDLKNDKGSLSYVVLEVPDEDYNSNIDIWLELEAIAKQQEEISVEYYFEKDEEKHMVHFFIFELNQPSF